MSAEKTELSPRRQFGTELRDIVRGETELSGLLLECSRLAVRATYLDAAQKREAMELAHSWRDYVRDNEPDPNDPYSVRHHITEFAKNKFSEGMEFPEVLSYDLRDVKYGGKMYADIISDYMSPEALSDPSIALNGGAARLALKILAGVDVERELPLHDVDVVISDEGSGKGTADRYGIDVASAKIFSGDLGESIPEIMANVDCTMNQVLIHMGRLYYTERALDDIQTGTIRILPKKDPLFGHESALTEEGEVYIDRRGLYRALSFLIRGKGSQIAISKENIEREKDNIGRYWLVILLVKLLPMQEQGARYTAIGHWHDLARQMGATESEDPESFFVELMTKYPETRATNEVGGVPDLNVQIRWLIEKLAGQVVDRVCGREFIQLPDTYTPTQLSLSDNAPDYDMDSLLATIKSTVHAAHA